MMLAVAFLAGCAVAQHLPAPPPPPPPPPVSGRVCGSHAMTVTELLEEMRDERTTCLAVGFAGGAMPARDAVNLATELEAHPTRRLKLADVDLGDDKVEILAPAIGALLAAGCADLTLARVGMGDRGAAAIAAALSRAEREGGHAHRGVTLDLSGNQIGDRGAERLAKALPGVIVELKLGQNNIGVGGATALQEQLSLSKVRALDLGANYIDGGVLARLRMSKNADGESVVPGSEPQRERPLVAPPTPSRRPSRNVMLERDLLEPPPPPRILRSRTRQSASEHEEFVPTRMAPPPVRPPPTPTPTTPLAPPPPPPPPDGATVDWEAAYDAVESLAETGLISNRAAKSLRRMAAKDDPAIGRIYNRFRGKPPELLAERLLDLVEEEL
jgi:hypothetical protein